MVLILERSIFYLVATVGCLAVILRSGYTAQMYFSIERPRIIWYDTDFYLNVTFKSKLLNRKDPIHYVTLNFTLKKTMDRNFMFDIYTDELLSNVYKRSFVEYHAKFCDMFEDQILGQDFHSGYYRIPEKERMLNTLKCPLPPGFYSFLNMRFHLDPLISVFPYQEGRAYINVTYEYMGRPNAKGSLDFHIKPLL